VVGTALAGAVLAFAPRLIEAFEAPKAALVRVLGAAALGGAVAAARATRRRGAWFAAPLDAAMLAWFAAETLATARSVAPVASLVGDPLQRDGWLTALGLLGLYGAARGATREPGAAARLLGALAGAAALASLYALVQAAQLDPLRWARVATYGPDGALVRPFGTLGHPNLLGVVTAAALCVALARAHAAPARRWLWAPLAALFAAATLLTFSRGAWLAALGGGAVTGALLLRAARRAAPAAARGARASAAPGARDARRALRRALLAAAALAAVVALFAVTGWGALFAERFGDLLSPTRASGSSRIEIWRAAIAMWLARPLTGQGPDTFGLLFPLHQTAAYWRYEWAGLPVQAHSVPLHALATRGAAGGLALLACAVAFAATARRAWRAPGAERATLAALIGAPAAVAVAGLFGAVGVTGALIAVVCAAALASAGEEAPLATTARRGRGAAVAAALAASVMGGYVATEMVASAASAASQRLARRARPGAVEQASRAARWAPFDDATHRVLAEALLVEALAGRGGPGALEQAEAAAREAVRRAPLRAFNHQRLAAVFAARAGAGASAAADSARAAWDRARALAPVSSLVLLERADFEIGAGRPDLAEPFAARAAELYPGDAFAWYALARCAVARGDRVATRRALDRALAADWHGREDERARARAARAVLR